MQLLKNNFKYILLAIVPSVALLGAAWIFSSSDFYIKNLGNSVQQDGRLVNTVTVDAQGTAYAKPDMVTFTATASELADSSQKAMERANNKINQVSEIAKRYGVADEYLKTSQLSISPEYDYQGNDRILKGQRARISLTVNVKNIDENAAPASPLLDEVAQIQDIQLGGINFTLENDQQALATARAEAMRTAKQKAQELSDHGEVKLLDPVSITEKQVSNNVVTPFRAYAAAEDTAKSSTQLQSGELEMSVQVEVVYGIE